MADTETLSLFRCLLETQVLGFHRWQRKTTRTTTKPKPKQTKKPYKLKKPKKPKPKLTPQNTQTNKKNKKTHKHHPAKKTPNQTKKNSEKIKRDKLMHLCAVQVNDLGVSVGVTQHEAKLKCFIMPES